MNSPPEPGSPSPSTPSSSSPPPDELSFATQPSGQSSGGNLTAANIASHLTSQFTAFISGGSASAAKRRLPSSSSFGAAGSSRDPKTRRRDDRDRRMGGGGGSIWIEGKEGGKREKDDLVDGHLVELLRKEIGDPFMDPTSIRTAA